MKLSKHQLAHQAQLRERELILTEEYAAQGLDATLDAIAQDRATRWAKLLDRPEDKWVADWANQMVVRFGPRVYVWRNHLDWRTALYVVRYGEAEHFWPERLTAEDRVRAQRWSSHGDTPNGVRYIVAEEG